MSKTIQRPKVTVNRVFTDKRTAMEAFVTVLVREMERRSVRTFETLNEPHYNYCESEGNAYDTDTTA
jgi:hypothetical protein